MKQNTSQVSDLSPSHQAGEINQSFILIAAGGLLQTLGETLSIGTSGMLPPGKALISFSGVTLGVALLWLALWRFANQQKRAAEAKAASQRGPATKIRRMIQGAYVGLLALAVLWTIATSGTFLIQHPLDPDTYDSDAAAFIHYQAEDILHGMNPYSDQTGFWKAIQQFPYAGATPLQRGQFSQYAFAPEDQTVLRLLHLYAQHPSQAGSEFDPASLHSYPAGAFLLAVPFVWAGLPSTQPLYILCLALLLVLLLCWSPSGQHWQTLLLFASLSVALLLTLRSSFEVVCILCILGAWRAQERHPWLASAILGVGCSVKQLTWLFVPFYLIWIARRAGWRQAALNGLLCGLVFLGINTPFFLLSPGAWASSMLLPVSEPAFPGGIGLITLAQGGLLPIIPTAVYTILEILAYVTALGWYLTRQFARTGKSRQTSSTDACWLVLAPLPLLLAPRSLISYTMFLPVLALAVLFRAPPLVSEEQELSAALINTRAGSSREAASG